MEDEADFFPKSEGEAENREHDGHFVPAVQEMENELALFSQLILQDDLTLEEITSSDLSLELQEALKDLLPNNDASPSSSSVSSDAAPSVVDASSSPSSSSASTSTADVGGGDGEASYDIMEVDVPDGELLNVE